MLKISTRQSMQRDQIFIFKTEGSTIAIQQNNFELFQYQILKSLRSGKCPYICPWALVGGLTPLIKWSSLLRLDEKVILENYLFTLFYLTFDIYFL